MFTHHQRLFLQHLSQYVTEHKKAIIEKVLSNRTRYLTIVLEDIYQSQNASAVIRTCECMGLQDVHIVENSARYSINRKVLKGADKWVTLHHYRDEQTDNQTATCFKKLRSHGYRIVAASPDERCSSIHSLDLTQRVAIVMGNELNGLSSYAVENCDQRVTVPMYGFTGSMNISVSAALCIQSVMNRIRDSGIEISLDDDEKDMLRYNWYKRIVRRSHILERQFLATIV
ncbi:MAG TPA: RNA methyltransferase [Cyclobacteriaceae bacterium]|nr:RNA methyltransferase [Cyclobacteriaceae bacterium]